MESDYYVIIILTTIGFGLLAAILLVPVYLFLRKEDEVGAYWTEEALAEEARRRDGAPAPEAGSESGADRTSET